MISAILNTTLYGNEASNIVFDENEILYIGNDISQYDIDFEINGKDLTVYPGFVDSHMHLLGYGFFLTNLNMSDCKSFSDVFDLIRTRKNDSKYPWIIARGINEDKLIEKRLPTRSELDDICSNKPVCILRACGHVMICNTKALLTAGFEEDQYVEGAHVYWNEGRVEENAIETVKETWPLETTQSIKDKIMLAQAKCNAYGITGVGSDDFISITKEYDEVLAAFEQLAYQNKLTLRVNEQCHFNQLEDYQRFLQDGYTFDIGDDYFRIGPLKIIADGSLGSKTALLSRPYNDDSSTSGINAIGAKELEAYLTLAQYYNMPFAIHVIGDQALDQVLDLYDKFHIEHNPLNNGLVHVQITRKEQLDKIIEYGLHCYIQSIFIDYDGTIVNSRVGDLAKTSYAFKTLFENTCVSNGSDAPVEAPDVLKGIYCAVTRKDLNGNVMNKKEALTVKQAIDSFTKNGYKISLEDLNKGELKVGYKPDMVLLDKDLEKIDVEDIKKTKVIMTIFDGRIVYEYSKGK